MKQAVVPTDWWIRQKDIPWQMVAVPAKNISFRYELDNHGFSQYSTDVEVTLWRVNVEVEPPQLEDMVLKVFSQNVTAAPFGKVQVEWVVDTSGLNLGDIAQQSPIVSGVTPTTGIPATSQPPRAVPPQIGPPPPSGTIPAVAPQSYPNKYAVVIKHDEIERTVILFFYPSP